jgi:hypothetical protein
MADDVDNTDLKQQQMLDAAIENTRKMASLITIPSLWLAGICEYCEEPTARLVNKHCARCRDKLKLS